MVGTLAYADQLVVLLCLGLTVGFLIQERRAISRWRLSIPRGPALAASGLLLSALAVRLAFPAAFVHSNFHGTTIVEQISRFPEPSHARAYFGQASFVVLGMVARWFDDPWRAVLVVNILASTITLGLLAVIATHAAGRVAGLATLAVGALCPALVRVAASEDAHNVGLMFGVLAIAIADHARRTDRFDTRILGLAAIATVLAVYSRHTFHPWPALTLAFLLPVGGARRVLTSRAFLKTLAVATVLCLPRLAELFVHSSDVASYRTMWILVQLFTEPDFLLRHPLLRPDESLLLTGLAVIGFASAIRHRERTGLIALVACVFWFLLTLPFSVHPSYNEEYAFRLPLIALMVLAAGLGTAALWTALHARISTLERRAVQVLGTLGILGLVAAPAAGLARVASDRDPQDQEQMLISLSSPATASTPLAVVGYDTPYLTPGYRPPGWALAKTGWAEEAFDAANTAPGTAVYQGLGCFAFGPLELAKFKHINGLISVLDGMDTATLLEWSTAMWDDPVRSITMLGGQLPADDMRPECRTAIPAGAEFIEWGTIEVHRQQAPHVFFTRRRIPIGVWKLSP